ncbi:MAG: S-layer homology domain-containing protein [Peptoniphilaceae bacterium]
MNKKILSLVLALVMVLGTFTSVFAAETKTEAKEEKATEKVEKIVGKENKIQYIIDKKFVEGYEDGDYGFDKNIKRSEITKLLVFANGNKELAEKLQGSMKLYSDVETSHWANGVITVGTTVPAEANGQAMLQGYPDKSFKPENDVTYAELAKMLVVLVKEDLTADMVTMANKNWASQWMTWAAQLGILDDVTVADSNKAANRADAFTMVYNALYKMANFKRVPANDKVGVLSSLKNNELVLNQDKDQTYKLTDKTVLVNTLEKNVSNVIKVENITNAEYYYGSLVRIMTNDKNEVTHILELGNPKEMALNAPANDPVKNKRWEGVADYTVETGFTDIDTLKNVGDVNYLEGYVQFDFNSSKTSVDKVKFMHRGKLVQALDVNDDTKVYVANPANNIMKEVEDITEALRLVGFQNYQAGYSVPNVYAGFDSDSHKSAIKGFDTSDENAKVIVFNVVSKSVDGDLYRVVNESNYNGKATLENTDGKLMDKDFFDNIANFPYNYGDKWDVVEVNTAANGYDSISTEIDHSDKVEFPVVEVMKIYNDGKELELRDVNNYKTVVDTRDADIFNAKQFKDLEVGAKVQFATTDKSTKIDILSILPESTKVEGSMRNVIKSIYGDTVVAKLLEVNTNANGNFATITVDSYNSIFNQEDNMGRAFYYITTDKVAELRKHIGHEIVFDVNTDMGGFFGKAFADNFRMNDGSETPIIFTDNVQAIRDLVEKANNEYNPDKVTVANLEEAKADVEKIEKAIDELTIAEESELEQVYLDKLDEVKAQFADVQQIIDDAKAIKDEIATLKTVDQINALTVQADLDSAAADLNTAIGNYNSASDEVKAELTTEKALLQDMIDAIKARDNVVDNENDVPAITELAELTNN